MNTYTPGPWRVTPGKHDLEWCIEKQVDSGCWLTVATVTRKEDAQLIAAAPDLIGSARLFVKWQAGPTNAHPLPEAKAAIAKAEGAL